MEQIISFHINTADKELIDAAAKKARLSLSAFCRAIIMQNILNQEEQNGRDE